MTLGISAVCLGRKPSRLWLTVSEEIQSAHGVTVQAFIGRRVANGWSYREIAAYFALLCDLDKSPLPETVDFWRRVEPTWGPE